jgi:hypothetical protein
MMFYIVSLNLDTTCMKCIEFISRTRCFFFFNYFGSNCVGRVNCILQHSDNTSRSPWRG